MLYINLGPFAYAMPYIERLMHETEITTEGLEGCTEATMLSPATPDDASLDAERLFIDRCRQAGAKWCVLRCPIVVGTGMTGFPRQLAEAVWRGTFIHTQATDVPISTIHASDVARAVALSRGCGASYVITDGSDCTLDALADALAARMNQKRIFKAWSWVGKLCTPRRLVRQAQALGVVDGKDFAARFHFDPTPVTTYLTTHNYDESSL